MVAPLSSAIDRAPPVFATMNASRSQNRTPANSTLRLASRPSVQVVLRRRRSTTPAFRAGNLSEALRGTKVTFSASPSAAAATARQKSTFSPDQRPDASFVEKPAIPSLTPQRNVPLDLTCASVSPAVAGGTTQVRTNSAMTVGIRIFLQAATIPIEMGGSLQLQ